MTHLIDHRPVDPDLVRQVVEHVRSSAVPPNGVAICGAFVSAVRRKVDVQRAIQVALDEGRLQIDPDMCLQAVEVPA